MKIVHVFNKKTNILIYMYFIDEVTGNKVDYSVAEFRESIKQ